MYWLWNEQFALLSKVSCVEKNRKDPKTDFCATLTDKSRIKAYLDVESEVGVANFLVVKMESFNYVPENNYTFTS